MATFDPKQFIENPDATEFKSLNKDKLLALAKHLELSDIKKSIKKSEIKNIVAEKLIEDEIFSEEEILSETDKMLLFKKLELEFQEKEREKERELELRKIEKEREFELKKLEMQERLEREKQAADREKLELQRQADREKLEMQQALEKEKLELEKLRLKQDSDKFEALEKKFDVTKYIRLVPPFQEKEVDQYFLHFEKVAKNLNWPKENWTMLLQSVLSGKAREIFTQLSVDQASNYDTVKTLILKGYELVPEAYRQKFRNWEKRNDQTYVEFARTKEQLFDRWCNSKKIEENFDKLRQLVLIEEFKRCIHSDVKTYIDEQSADTLDNAARLADDYALTHKVSFSGKPQKSFTNKNPNSSGNFKQNSQAKNKSQSENKTSSDSNTKPKSEPGQTAKSMTCYYCKEPGHMKFDCPLLKNKEQRKITGRTTVNFVSKFGTVSNFVKDVHDTLVKESNSVCKPTEESSSVIDLEEAFGSDSFFDLEEFNSNSFCDLEDESNSNSLCTLENEPSPICEQNVGSSTLCGFVKKLNSPCKPNMEGFEPFIHDGFVSLSSDMKDAKPIKYLRDTGALQSVILADVLPFTNETDTGLGALVKGLFEDDYSIAPLHKLYLSTDLVSGHVTMGVRKKMDCDGIQVILGNDLAGKKVFADPIVTENPSLESHVDPIEKEVPGIYPVCAVTRSMSLKLKDKENSNVETSEKNSESFDELPCENKIFSRSEMIAEQQKDPEISKLFSMAVDYDEVSQNPVCYYEKHGVLMRKWRPPDVNSDEDWAIRHQIVVPKSYRSEILKLAHENVLSGHLGINKTYQKVSVHFYWPGIRKDVVEFCRSCHTCQVVGKPNQTPPKAPLKPIPAFEEPSLVEEEIPDLYPSSAVTRSLAQSAVGNNPIVDLDLSETCIGQTLDKNAVKNNPIVDFDLSETFIGQTLALNAVGNNPIMDFDLSETFIGQTLAQNAIQNTPFMDVDLADPCIGQSLFDEGQYCPSSSSGKHLDMINGGQSCPSSSSGKYLDLINEGQSCPSSSSGKYLDLFNEGTSSPSSSPGKSLDSSHEGTSSPSTIPGEHVDSYDEGLSSHPSSLEANVDIIMSDHQQTYDSFDFQDSVRSFLFCSENKIHDQVVDENPSSKFITFKTFDKPKALLTDFIIPSDFGLNNIKFGNSNYIIVSLKSGDQLKVCTSEDNKYGIVNYKSWNITMDFIVELYQRFMDINMYLNMINITLNMLLRNVCLFKLLLTNCLDGVT